MDPRCQFLTRRLSTNRVAIPPRGADGFRRSRAPRTIRCSLAIILALLAVAQAVPGLSADETPELKTIQINYERSISALACFWVKYEWTLDFENEELAHDGRSVVEWASDGRKSLYRYEGVFLKSGKPVVPQASMTDGSTTWGFTYSENDDGQIVLEQVWKRKHEAGDGRDLWNGPHSDTTFSPYLGRWINWFNHSLANDTLSSLLAESDSASIEPDDVTGANCWHVDFGVIQRDADTTAVQVDAWFDPAAGWLPRRIRMQNPDEPNSVNDLVVHEFMPANGLLGQTWFPSICKRETYGARSELRVLEAKFNEVLPNSLFVPSIPAGTEVVDVTDPQALVEADRRRLREQILAERAAKESQPDQRTAAVPTTLDARPVQRSNSQIVLLVCGVAALAAAAWLVFRGRN